MFCMNDYLIKPHGGVLIDCFDDSLHSIDYQFVMDISLRTLNDLNMISTGVFSPLCGFMNYDNFNSVISNSLLSNGICWTIPIVLPLDNNKQHFSEGNTLFLRYNEVIYASIKVESIYTPDKSKWVKSVYGTDDLKSSRCFLCFFITR